MEEETIFTGGAPDQVNPSPASQDTTVNQQVEQHLSPEISGDNGSRFMFLKGKLIKIILGFFVVALVLFIILAFIVPRFSKSSTEDVTLTYWGLWEDERVMSSVISEFERENPRIKINYSKQDIREYRERLMTRFESGEGPDVFRFHNTWYPMLSSLLIPFPSDVISKEDFRKRYYPVAQKDLIKNGAIYGIPLSIDTLVLYINREKFEAGGYSPPQNWNDFVTVATNLTVKNESGGIETSGAAIGTFENVARAPDIISLLFAQNGVNMEDITKSRQRVVDAIDFYTVFAKGDDKIWDSSLDPSILAFAGGNVAMIFGYSWDYFTIQALNPDLDFYVAPVPQLSSESPKNMVSYWAEGVSVRSKNQNEAFLFMNFLAKPQTQEKIYTEAAKTRLFGGIYSDTSLANLLHSDPNLKVFVDQARSATSSYFSDATFDNGLNTRLNAYLKDAVNSVLGSGSTQTSVDTLFQGFTQVLRQYETQE